MIIQEILKQLILEKGVNVSDVVRDTGLSPTPIYAILNGRAKRPLSSTIKKLADYFGVSPKYLLTGETEPTADPLAARVAELERQAKVAGPALHKISLNDGQRQYLHDKYIVKDVVSVAGRVDDLKPNALETLYRLLFLWDEIIRKGKVNDGRPES